MAAQHSGVSGTLPSLVLFASLLKVLLALPLKLLVKRLSSICPSANPGILYCDCPKDVFCTTDNNPLSPAIQFLLHLTVYLSNLRFLHLSMKILLDKVPIAFSKIKTTSTALTASIKHLIIYNCQVE